MPLAPKWKCLHPRLEENFTARAASDTGMTTTSSFMSTMPPIAVLLTAPPSSESLRRIRRDASAERERERFHARAEELDYELTIGDEARLPDQLVQTLIDRGSVAVRVDFDSVSGARRLAVDEHPEADPLHAIRRSLETGRRMPTLPDGARRVNGHSVRPVTRLLQFPANVPSEM